MESLPNEIVCMILHHVDLSDLITHVKLVAKRFYSLVSVMKFEELVVNFGASTTNHWYHTMKPVNPKNIIASASRDFLQSPAFAAHFASLKSLKISSAEAENFDVEQLNQLRSLEQLDLHIQFDRKVTLSLPALRRLSVFTYSLMVLDWSQHIRLAIDCRRLEVLCCNDLTDIELLHPTSIRRLEVGFYHLIDLDRFTNLEALRFNTAEMHLGEASGLTRAPASLKCLQLNYSSILTKLGSDRNLLAILEHELPADTEVYLNEVRWLKRRPLDDYGFELTDLQLYAQNYADLSGRITRCLHVSYDELLTAFDQRIPADFQHRFVNVQQVIASRVPDPGGFLLFLSGCSVLRELELNCLSLGDHFYRQLPNALKVLMKLKLNESENSNESKESDQSDFSFLAQFNLLFTFSTNQRLCAALSVDLFSCGRFLRSLQFKRGQTTIVVSKTAKNQFDLQLHGDEVERWTSIGLDQLAELIKRDELLS